MGLSAEIKQKKEEVDFAVATFEREGKLSNPRARAARAPYRYMEKIYGNLWEPARVRRACNIHKFYVNHRYSMNTGATTFSVSLTVAHGQWAQKRRTRVVRRGAQRWARQMAHRRIHTACHHQRAGPHHQPARHHQPAPRRISRRLLVITSHRRGCRRHSCRRGGKNTTLKQL